MKVGRSDVGAAAAATHTGAIAGSDAVFDGVLRQFGVARAHDIDHLLDLGRVLALCPPPAGRRLSVVTLSGGAGVLVSDHAADLGIDMPRWDDEWAARMQAELPAFAAVRNPIDTTGALVTDASILRGALRVMCVHPDTDIVLVVVGNMQQQEAEVCDIIAEAAAQTEKPVVTAWIGGSGRVPATMAERGLAAFPEPVRAVRAISALLDSWQVPRPVTPGVAAHEEVVQDDSADHEQVSAVHDEVAVKQVLRRHGVPTVHEMAAADPDAAVAAAENAGWPVVLKLLSTEVAHKSDLGLVRVGLPDATSVHQAATDVLRMAEEHGIADCRLVVQQMVSSQTELILGMRRDETFGPVIALGIGGVLTEVVSDVQIRISPLAPGDVESMLDGLRFAELLNGPRGRPAVDRAALVQAVLAFDRAVASEGHTWESVEVNPLLIDPDGRPVAVDALALGVVGGPREPRIGSPLPADEER